MKNVFILILLSCIHVIAYAQEVNIGIHANPILSTPILSKKSVLQEPIKPYAWALGYNVGANLNVKFNKFSVETGMNYLRKAVTVTQRQEQLGFDTYYRIAVPSRAVEIPVTLNLLMYHHDKDKVYDVYFVMGAAYEMGTVDSSLSSAVHSGSGGGGGSLMVDGRYIGPLTYNTITPIVGFKINAVLRNVGLIDYGVSFHYPLAANGPYIVESKYSFIGSSGYQNAIYAHTAYIDIKFAYYFLNIGKDLKRVRYRRGW